MLILDKLYRRVEPCNYKLKFPKHPISATYHFDVMHIFSLEFPGHVLALVVG